MNPKLQAISDRAQSDLAAFIAEAEDKLLEAWNAAEIEAQDNETKPVFRIAFSVKLDIDSDNMETALSFGVRHKLSKDGAIPHPTQTKLALSE